MKRSTSILFRAAMLALVAMLVFTSSVFAARQQSFTVGSWSRVLDEATPGVITVSDLTANDVNWQGFPRAARLDYGVESCWPSGSCNISDFGSLLIEKKNAKYPQGKDVSLGGSWVISDADVDGCSFVPYVDLIAADGTLLGEIYFVEFQNRCIVPEP